MVDERLNVRASPVTMVGRAHRPLGLPPHGFPDYRVKGRRRHGGARSARIGMFAEAIGAIATYCGRPWGRRVGLRVTAWTRHLMSIAIDIVAAIARLLVRISEDRDAAENQDADYQGCGLGCEGKPTHAQ